VTITGNNAALRTDTLKKLVDQFVAKHGDFGVQRIEAESSEISDITAALQTTPFLTERSLVVLYTPGQIKDFAEKVEQHISSVAEAVDTVIIEPKLDKRSLYYKTLKAKTDFKDCTELDERGLADWLVKRVKAAGGSISRGDALFLIERVGADQLLLTNETDKLVLYKVEISRKTIELMTEPSPSSTIFELVEAAFAGKPAQALHLYDEQRALKVEPQQIIAMLTWQLHVLAILVAAAGQSPDTVASQTKISPYTLRKSSRLASNLTRADVTRLVRRLLEIDSRSKRAAIDLDDALRQYILTLA